MIYDNFKMDTTNVIIREGKADDCEQISKLIRELAAFDRMPDGPKTNAEKLRKDGFGAEKMFHLFVAETGGIIVGYALYFFKYSSWEGVCVYLEDLYVSPSYRHHGIGTRLWRKVAQVAVDRKCNRVDWTCLSWNERAVQFYKSKGAVDITSDKSWHLFRLCGEKLKEFANNKTQC